MTEDEGLEGLSKIHALREHIDNYIAVLSISCKDTKAIEDITIKLVESTKGFNNEEILISLLIGASGLISSFEDAAIKYIRELK